MFKKYFFILPIIMATSQAQNYDDITIGMRAGIDLTSYSISSDDNLISASIPRALPNLTLDIDKHINKNISFGLSASHNLIRLLSQSYHAYSTGLSSNYHLSSHNSVGIGASILHIPVINDQKIYQNFSGYINSLRVGISMKNLISENIYTHVEVMHDISPSGYRSYELTPSKKVPAYSSLFLNAVSAQCYSANISIGFNLHTVN